MPATALALVLALVVAGPAGSRAPTPYRPVEGFESVTVPSIDAVETVEPISDFPVGRSFEPIPLTTQPTAATEPVATPKPPTPPKAPKPPSRTHSAVGGATWYCLPGKSACPYVHSGGMYAAAGPALRVGKWRGRNVTVCGNDHCIRVQLVDWCACGGGHVIDLFADAFRRLAPLSSGVVHVKVTW